MPKPPIKETHLKALTHGALALLGLMEVLDCKSPTRKLVTGCLVGWHMHAIFYHLVLEKDEQ